jgi:hypothetical protein
MSFSEVALFVGFGAVVGCAGGLFVIGVVDGDPAAHRRL